MLTVFLAGCYDEEGSPALSTNKVLAIKINILTLYDFVM